MSLPLGSCSPLLESATDRASDNGSSSRIFLFTNSKMCRSSNWRLDQPFSVAHENR